jgi:shikimate dehydrogenase
MPIPTTPFIDGKTLVFATPGYPVSQIRLPILMNHVFPFLGLNAIWIPIEVQPQNLQSIFTTFRNFENFKGMTIAIPYKNPLVNDVDEATERARRSGCVNLIRFDEQGRSFGDTVDGLGFVTGLLAKGITVQHKSVFLVGTGGAGCALAVALCDAGIQKLYLKDIFIEKAQNLAQKLSSFYPDIIFETTTEPPANIDLAINASNSGLQISDPLPFDPCYFEKSTVIADIIMKPKETKLLERAATNGYIIHHGHHTLDYQISLYLDFFGIEHDPEAVLQLVQSIP